MRRRHPRPANLTRRRVQPLGGDLRSMLIESHDDRHSGPPQAPRFPIPARTSAALELRRSLHARPDGALLMPSIKSRRDVPDRRRATQRKPVRPNGRQRESESARRQPEPPLEAGRHRPNPNSKRGGSTRPRVLLPRDRISAPRPEWLERLSRVRSNGPQRARKPLRPDRPAQRFLPTNMRASGPAGPRPAGDRPARPA